MILVLRLYKIFISSIFLFSSISSFGLSIDNPYEKISPAIVIQNMESKPTPTPKFIATGLDPTPTPTHTRTPTPDCYQKAIDDFAWDDSHALHWYCWIYPYDCTTTGQCIAASILAGDAGVWANNNYGFDPNMLDAARHVWWSLRMAEEIGQCAAKQIADAYEVDEINTDAERYKDLYNNKVGRELANQPGTVEERIASAFANGTIHTVDGC